MLEHRQREVFEIGQAQGWSDRGEGHVNHLTLLIIHTR